MKVWTQWYGGNSYRAPEHGEYEEFSSISTAKWIFQDRFNDRRFPCVDEENAEMFVFLSDPSDSIDPHPDFSFTLGPRGGIRRNVL